MMKRIAVFIVLMGVLAIVIFVIDPPLHGGAILGMLAGFLAGIINDAITRRERTK